jgi:anthranilate synthase/aminodeoxychorismate synthase-like glutamine amidotransferase
MSPRVFVIDNYDSFTFNLVQYLGELGAETRVEKNDALPAEAVGDDAPDGILLSPGPCTPNEAGICLDVIAKWSGKIPILGVCLGHQSIGQAFGGKVVRASRLMHGRTSPVVHDGSGIFADLPSPFEAGRYHSLLVEESSLPSCLRVSAWTADPGQPREIMGLRHETYDVVGVQFHPESILTPEGKTLLSNWLRRLSTGNSRA